VFSISCGACLTFAYKQGRAQFSSLAKGLSALQAGGRRIFACVRKREPTNCCVRKRLACCVLGAPRGRQRPERISLGYIQERQREQVRIAQLLEAIRQTAIHFPGAVATVSLLLMLTLRIRALPALYLADQTSAPHPPTDLLRPGTRRRLLLRTFASSPPQPHP
jgi:hypothetical protein